MGRTLVLPAASEQKPTTPGGEARGRVTSAAPRSQSFSPQPPVRGRLSAASLGVGLEKTGASQKTVAAV